MLLHKMAAVKICRQLILKPASSKLLQACSTVVIAERTAYWNRDWKPEPRPPQGADQHAAAAHKYGLLPADYRPLPDDGAGLGDYPAVPLHSAEARDPNYNWDMPELKRDFGEPIHHEMDMFGEDRYNADRRLRISIPQMWAAFLAVVAGYSLLFFYFDNKKMFRPVMPRQYVRDGPHYSFQLKE
ncbi:NADH dehydrogenase [ubiquinone] 1 beta subcomplex subunit 8, mitochondrial-like [Amphibalanus amphitrite]|uniref:NADH dehydrogenase [ubiquinone] 1 beta subcomplex subunit 8, mitochondrial-like n=1 Tax=Amphibalanus amphitrite TaxID=1232801 RepID=UPI001C912BC4|nr:NADH dehydrogenase [ubiquinone] 1 beta subcomplex subunit 8, mitochondrial-like [Amphibalanus amphitrite]XP_043235561.1 NADH dehydrogenase [ubiquinone] 1 beta subcomplex subunit 8, mitochondrial-like [Amphibalanus amphitrite]XP_043235562.1 NADH dehydrogenase [ubiquinone] 1 beta subcomplex subunit 8, mitochondrial-like [Amphibalanus amphitrite]XP_043235563.1 NADH dehydrogenase [ubiquinone] 1 beta subcomplex subunit 8, mitochondrial-like [Amphibalanus amphitrite]XP_043235564.1 NADH dehydrogena